MNPLSYAIVSAVRNEERFLPETAESVVGQTVPPRQWVIVDDGSTDRTAQIAQEYAAEHPWIQVLRREDRGAYRLGGGVVESFLQGLEQVDIGAVEYICKLDADLRLEPGYFERLLWSGQQDPKLGILSGVTYFEHGGRLIAESVPADFAIGAAKLWRVRCFQDIGGLVSSLGWDVLDVVRAQMRGWKVRSFPELRITHFRPMSSRDNWYAGRVRNGHTDYILGNHPLFQCARVVYRMAHRPYVMGGLCILAGYLRGALRREPLIVTDDEKAFRRKHQMRRLFGRTA